MADGITAVLVLAGVAFFVAGTAGVLRFPGAHDRLHAVAKADGLALGLVVAGLLPQAGSVGEALRLLAVWLVALAAAATAGALISLRARRG